MNIPPVVVELFHADRRTDRQTDRHDEAILRNLANVPKNWSELNSEQSRRLAVRLTAGPPENSRT
jgi:hypothetical protein